MEWIFTLLVVVLIVIFLHAGMYICSLKSTKRSLEDFEMKKNTLPWTAILFLGWYWKHRRRVTHEAIKQLGDKTITSLFHAAGWVLIVASLFATVMIVLIHLGII